MGIKQPTMVICHNTKPNQTKQIWMIILQDPLYIRPIYLSIYLSIYIYIWLNHAKMFFHIMLSCSRFFWLNKCCVLYKTFRFESIKGWPFLHSSLMNSTIFHLFLFLATKISRSFRLPIKTHSSVLDYINKEK